MPHTRKPRHRPSLFSQAHGELHEGIFSHHTPTGGGVNYVYRSWTPRVSRSVLVWDDQEVILPLIVGQHHGNAVGKGLVLQGQGGALPVFAGPDRADAGPDFLASLLF